MRIRETGGPPSLLKSDLPLDTTIKDARTLGKERTRQAEVESILAGYPVEYDGRGFLLGPATDTTGVYRK